MLALEPRAARAGWTIFLLALLVGTLYLVRDTLVIFVVSILLAYLLAPVVGLVDHYTSARISRTLSLGVVYVVLLSLAGVLLAVVGSRIAAEAGQLASTLPKYLKEPQRLQQLPIPWWLETYQDAIVGWVVDQVQSHQDQIVPMLTKAGKGLLSAVGSALFLVIVPILSFFFLKDAAEIRDVMVAQFTGDRRAAVAAFLDDVHGLLVQFVRAMVLLALATFTVFSVVLGLMGVPYALLLSAVAGLGEFVPIAGPVITGLTVVIVAAFGGYGNVLVIVGFLLVYRLFLDYVLQPYLMGHGVELPPLAIIFGVLAGEELGGVLGMFLSIPVLAILRIVYVHYRRSQAIAST